MQLNKIKLTKESSDRLKQLKIRTGLTPNILTRIGFCLSLADPTIPDPEDYPEEDREFNRYTLLGEWDAIYVALLKQRIGEEKLVNSHDEIDVLRAHLNRGVLMLSRQVKSLVDLLAIKSADSDSGPAYRKH
jgi:DNA sulfur modification protein DndE